MKRIIINVDWNSLKSIKCAERLKAKLENNGYTLIHVGETLTNSRMTYEIKV
jgi:hypothetical protein